MKRLYHKQHKNKTDHQNTKRSSKIKNRHNNTWLSEFYISYTLSVKVSDNKNYISNRVERGRLQESLIKDPLEKLCRDNRNSLRNNGGVPNSSPSRMNKVGPEPESGRGT